MAIRLPESAGPSYSPTMSMSARNLLTFDRLMERWPGTGPDGVKGMVLDCRLRAFHVVSAYQGEDAVEVREVGGRCSWPQGGALGEVVAGSEEEGLLRDSISRSLEKHASYEGTDPGELEIGEQETKDKRPVYNPPRYGSALGRFIPDLNIFADPCRSWVFQLKDVEEVESQNPDLKRKRAAPMAFVAEMNRATPSVPPAGAQAVVPCSERDGLAEKASPKKRPRAQVNQGEAASRCGVSLRQVGRWDKGESAPTGYPGRLDRVAFLQWSEGYKVNKALSANARAKNRAASVDPFILDTIENESALD